MSAVELHPDEADRLIAAAQVELRLERGERAGRAWVGPEGALLQYPLPDGGERRLRIEPQLLVDALVRLNDVGPRPAHEKSSRIVLPAGGLADALARRDASRVALEDAERSDALRELIGSLREHWRVVSRWDAPAGQLGGRMLEVLDTDAGYWLVVPDGASVELWPVTATDVFRALCRLFPGPSELLEEPPA